MINEIWKEIKSGLILISAIWLAFEIIKPTSRFEYLSIILSLIFIHDCIIQGCRETISLSEAKKLLITAGVVLLLIWLFELSASYGVVGFISIILLYSAYRMWRGRSLMLKSMRLIETRIFGEPLDKERRKKENEYRNN